MVQKYTNLVPVNVKRDEVMVIFLEITFQKGRCSKFFGAHTEMRKRLFCHPHLIG